MEITEVTLTQHLVQHSTWVMCPHYEETGKRRVNLDMVPCWELDFSILKLSVTLNYNDIMKQETCPFIYGNIWMMSEQITQILRRQWNLSCFCCFLEKSSIVGCLSFSQFGLKYSALDTDSILNDVNPGRAGGGWADWNEFPRWLLHDLWWTRGQCLDPALVTAQ